MAPSDLPSLLAALSALQAAPQEDEDEERERVDFEAYPELESAADTRSWIRAWTGNDALTGAELRVFGQDGTGGRAAVWRIDPDAELLAQPIVFFGSEGETGVVAVDFADFLWVLADGIGPYEAVANPNWQPPPDPGYTQFAATHAPAARKSAREVIARARAGFGEAFAAHVRALCQSP